MLSHFGRGGICVDVGVRTVPKFEFEGVKSMSPMALSLRCCLSRSVSD